MLALRLTESAFVTSGEHRITLPSDRPSIDVLYTWYEASAVDAAGKCYTVVWAIRDGFDLESRDEDDACEWANPLEILDECGHYVNPASVKLIL